MKLDKGQRVVYYEDELNDDFADNGLQRPPLSADYKYTRNRISGFFAALVCYLFAFPVLSILCAIKGIKVKGKKKLKQLKHTGYFLYGNHTCWIDAIIPAIKIAFPKRTNLVGYTDAMTIPIAKRLLKPLGYMPITDKLSDLKKFNKAVDYFISKKYCIAIYPEAHIWPYHTGVRKFLHTSFRYPARLNVPVVPFFTTYRKSKFSDKPKMIINIGEPIYCDPDLSISENTEMLATRTYEYMLNCSKTLPNYEYIKYIKKEEAETASNDEIFQTASIDQTIDSKTE